jgi:lipopolysaccharide/colanic/teichoic acid biosynthesis glycosyltransferase
VEGKRGSECLLKSVSNIDFNPQYTDYDKQRLYVVPGCTGLWQATERNNVGFDEMVELDLEYIQDASVMNDLNIILKTVAIIFKPNGSY